MTTARVRVGWAVLFGLSMGVGIGVATARSADTGLADPLVLAAGGTGAVLVGALVFGATLTGDRTRNPE